MITLKTLPQATAQEVFDQVASHLLTQNARCRIDGGACLYHNRSNGMRCAAGCLISDDEYIHLMENQPWNMLASEKIVPEEHEDLICHLQGIHDDIDIESWPDMLSICAKEYNLSPAILHDFQ